jgi:hypothetical protein
MGFYKLTPIASSRLDVEPMTPITGTRTRWILAWPATQLAVLPTQVSIKGTPVLADTELGQGNGISILGLAIRIGCHIHHYITPRHLCKALK